MTVNITFSSTAGGYAMTDTQNSGTVVPGGVATQVQDIFIRHDADYAPITDCAWYIQRCVSINYTGDDADRDLAEIKEWGDADGFGFQINQNPIEATWQRFNNAQGTPSSQLGLPQVAVTQGVAADDGEIPVGGEAHVQVKWKVPASVPYGADVRGLSLVFAYSATS